MFEKIRFTSALLFLSLLGCADSIESADSSTANRAKGWQVSFENVLQPRDRIWSAPATTGADDDKSLWIHASGTDVVSSMEDCGDDTDSQICFQFGSWFTLSLPCHLGSIAPEWKYQDWSFSVNSAPFEFAGAPAILINALSESGRTVSVFYSYEYGVVQFVHFGIELTNEGGDLIEVPITSAIYIVRQGVLGRAKEYCE